MNRAVASSGLRAAGCVMLLAMLAVSGFIGAGKDAQREVSVPVTVQRFSGEELSHATAKEIRESLRAKREEEIALLDSVINHPASADETIRQALEQKSQLAERMEQEAQAEAALAYAGYSGVGVLSGLQTISIFAPYAYMSDEASRVRMIDCVCMHTGVLPEDVKIILAKNE